MQGTMASESRLLRLERQLVEDGSVSIVGAAVELGVSEMTIRRDLAELEGRGTAKRVRGGAKARTLNANTRAFETTEFRPRVMCGIRSVDTSASVLGREVPIPLALSPTGCTRIADPQGELAVARAAARVPLRPRCGR